MLLMVFFGTEKVLISSYLFSIFRYFSYLSINIPAYGVLFHSVS